MLWSKSLRFTLLGVVLAGCALSDKPRPSGPVPTSTMAPFVGTTPLALASPERIPLPEFPILETSTGSYPNVVALLDGVCFDYLYALNGQTWVWTALGDLAAFYDQVDASGLCVDPVERAAFDFDGRVLAGAVD
ncbi:MAG TPA: hypothetical protein VMT24_15980, partial [Aggregatilineaceae bacterium]|nr:hypothetical protein [Aggregatilineaceae bacterium]